MNKDLLRHSVDRAALLRRLDRNRLKAKEKIGGLRSPLTCRYRVVNTANMSAELITGFKDVTSEGDIIEMVIWRLPEPVPPCEHSFKYRLVFVVAGERVVGFDNERGKGDHRHIGNNERPYAFVGTDRLIEDFISEVEAWRGAH